MYYTICYTTIICTTLFLFSLNLNCDEQKGILKSVFVSIKLSLSKTFIDDNNIVNKNSVSVFSCLIQANTF